VVGVTPQDVVWLLCCACQAADSVEYGMVELFLKNLVMCGHVAVAFHGGCNVVVFMSHVGQASRAWCRPKTPENIGSFVVQAVPELLLHAELLSTQPCLQDGTCFMVWIRARGHGASMWCGGCLT